MNLGISNLNYLKSIIYKTNNLVDFFQLKPQVHPIFAVRPKETQFFSRPTAPL